MTRIPIPRVRFLTPVSNESSKYITQDTESLDKNTLKALVITSYFPGKLFQIGGNPLVLITTEPTSTTTIVQAGIVIPRGKILKPRFSISQKL